MNMRPAGEDPAYVVVPTMALVEFLPVDQTGTPLDGAEPVLADQVQVNQPALRHPASFR